MGVFLEQVASRLNSPEALAHRVVLYLRNTERKALIVEAGDDLIFYSALLRRHKNRAPIELFAANGRNKVIFALSTLQKMGKKDCSYAIVDRDFNVDEPDRLLDGHCLVLDVFSFENYFGDKEVLYDIGKVFFALDPDSDFLTLWNNAVVKFLECLPTVLKKEHSVAMSCHAAKANCNLNDFKLFSHISVTREGNISMLDGVFERFIEEARVDLAAVDSKKIEENNATLNERCWKQWFRGHYFWKILIKFINIFREYLDDLWRHLKISRARTKPEITERHALEAATSFLPTPQHLEPFFAELLKQS